MAETCSWGRKEMQLTSRGWTGWDAARVGSRQLWGKFQVRSCLAGQGLLFTRSYVWRRGTKPVHPKGTVSLTGLLP